MQVNQLTVKNFSVDPEKFTGPFFSLLCNAKCCEIVMKKLLDVSVFLASSTPTAQVTVNLRRDKKDIVIQIKIPNPNLTQADLSSLFVPNYAQLAKKTNILAGSGLEGYLIQTLSEKMKTPVTVDFDQTNTSHLIFTWELKKKPEAMSAQEQ
jgi:hypothetical protein